MKLRLETLADVADDIREALDSGEITADDRIVVTQNRCEFSGSLYWDWEVCPDPDVLRLYSGPASNFVPRNAKVPATEAAGTFQ